MAREIFPKAPLKYMPPTKFMTGNIFRGHVQDALFNMADHTDTSKDTSSRNDDRGYTYSVYVRQSACNRKCTVYLQNNEGFGRKEIEFKENGIIRNRANEVLTKAANLLSDIETQGLFATLEKGTFADIKRPFNGGKGLDGVVVKDSVYFNPFIPLMKKEVKDE